MKNPIYFVLFLVFCLCNLIDIITTLFILPGEANPIYLLTKSLLSLIILKIILCIIIFFIYYRNKYSNNITYFLYVSILVYGSMVIGIACYNNISVYLINPQAIVDAVKIPVQVKLEAYSNFMLIYYIIPMLMQIISFMIYEKSVKSVEIIKSKWWQW